MESIAQTTEVVIYDFGVDWFGCFSEDLGAVLLIFVALQTRFIPVRPPSAVILTNCLVV